MIAKFPARLIFEIIYSNIYFNETITKPIKLHNRVSMPKLHNGGISPQTSDYVLLKETFVL